MKREVTQNRAENQFFRGKNPALPKYFWVGCILVGQTCVWTTRNRGKMAQPRPTGFGPNQIALATTEQEQEWVRGCLQGKLKAQEMLYRHFYGYGMSICLRYSGSRDEAAEILNDSFLKVFAKMKQYDPEKSFKAWLRRIVVNTAIDHYRRNQKYAQTDGLEEARTEECDADAIDQLTASEIMQMVQALPEAHRLAFNLYEIEGFNHEEIGEMLGIPVGTSKSNLSRAKKKLREMIGAKFGARSYEQI
jgi:RNA polymerase sigma factor (sigma-70 family)